MTLYRKIQIEIYRLHTNIKKFSKTKCQQFSDPFR